MHGNTCLLFELLRQGDAVLGLGKNNLRLGVESVVSFWSDLDLMASVPFLQYKDADAS